MLDEPFDLYQRHVHSRGMHDAASNGMDTRSNREAINGVTKTLIIVAIIGAVNWGLVGFFNFNLVDAIFGGGSAEQTSTGSRVVYAIVGLCGLVALLLLPKLHAEPVGSRPASAVSR